MKIALIGYGKMGKTIARIAQSRGHVISVIVDMDTQSNIQDISKQNTDVIIEFTGPDSAYSNIMAALHTGVPILSGSTGWLDHFDDVKALCEERKGTFFYAANYSLGVNLFFKLNAHLAAMMDDHTDYGVSIEETHHTEKLDKPSGTAIQLAEGIASGNSRYSGWELGGTNVDKIPVQSLRTPDVPGTHVVTYTSAWDQIEIKHTAKTRDAFAAGAVEVAEWVQHKVGVLSMNNYLNSKH